jgi:hydrogenase maturation protein HypF
MKQIIHDLDHHVPVERIAYKFHGWLADVIYEVASQSKVNHIAMSGGVFQNALLLDLIEECAHHNFTIYLNKELSSNDENISLGQLACVSVKERMMKKEFAINYH